MPEPWGRQLQDYRVRLGDLAAIQIPTHITLLAPLEVAPADRQDHQTSASGGGGQSDSIKVHLRGTGTFRPVSPVVFINVATGISSWSDCHRRSVKDH
ncbi:MAG: 2'-5' RNA ligase family protein [Nocardioidaceae bacterium]